MTNNNLTKEFFELLKAIGESKSKQEEDRIIEREIVTLKKKLESPNSQSKSSKTSLPSLNTGFNTKRKLKEFIVRLLYVEMLGHDGSFGYIKALELTASNMITHKRTGYLLCAACLPPEHEFRFMLVNQMQRDLNSSSLLEVCAALVSLSILITPDMVPALQAEVIKLLDHGSESVRKKAIIVLYRFHVISPECVPRMDVIERLRRMLCDRDPAVMGSSLNVIESMAENDSLPFKDLVPSLVSILKQICEHRLPSDFDYHRVPAPWIQMKIVRILGILGRKDANSSNGMYEILGDCMKKSDIGINAGNAVVYECVRTITSIYPNPVLLDAAAEAISRFISSRSQNLRYLGVTGLAAIVEAGPQYAAPHQLAVIECLEDRDDTLQRKTLDLLYRMTNPVNVEFITSKMLQFLRGTTDIFLKKSLTHRICTVAERYAPSNAWYIKTITKLFEISGDLVKPDVAQNLMSLIAEGTSADESEEEADVELRRNAVELYIDLLERRNLLPKILTETMAWVLGEYAYLSTRFSLEDILEKLCSLAKKTNTLAAPSTRKFLATAIMKLVAQAGKCPSCAAHVIDDFTKSRDVDLQQRCLEFQNILTSASHVLGDILPVDASCEDVQVDEHLGFLSGFVIEAKQRGAQEYNPPLDEEEGDDYISKVVQTGFNITPYDRPKAPTNLTYANAIQPSQGNLSGPAALQAGHNSLPPKEHLQLRSSVNVWGKGGLSENHQPDHVPVAPTNPNSTNSFVPQDPYYSKPNVPQDPYSNNSYIPQQKALGLEKSQAQIERERMAAQLFGGVVESQTAPPAPAVHATPAPPSSMPPAPVVNPKTAPVPSPTPAPEVDLLDLYGAPSDSPEGLEPVATFSLPNKSPSISTQFQYDGNALKQNVVTTAQFAQTWGGLQPTQSLQITCTKTAAEFIKSIEGFRTVEIISATNEGIASSQILDKIILLHCKQGNQRMDVTLKSDEENIPILLANWIKEYHG